MFEWSLPAGVWLLLIRAIALMLAVATWGEASSPLLPWFWLLVAFMRPLTRLLVVPLGVPHVSYWLTRVAFFGMGRAEAVFDELVSRLRRGRRLDPDELERFAFGLFHGETDRNVRGACLAVRAILDALGGDIEQSRALFRLTAELNWRLAPRHVRAYAQAWLLADAARRGAWHEVVLISKRGPMTRRALFFRAAARRILQRIDAPGEFVLALTWLAAPNRAASLPLYDAARAVAPRSPLPIVRDGLAGVRQSTYLALRQGDGAVTRSEIRALATAWQEVFDSGEHQDLIEARCKELAVEIDAEQIASEFETEVVTLLAELWRQSLPDRSIDTDDPALIVAAKDELQFELLGEFETVAGSLPSGEEEDDDEGGYEPFWRSWARLRGLARDYLTILPERGELLCDAGCDAILNHGAWLYNGKQARALAHNVFCWLLPRFPKGSENRKTVKRNIRLSHDA